MDTIQEVPSALFFGMTSNEMSDRVFKLSRETQADLAGGRLVTDGPSPAERPHLLNRDGRANMGCFTDRARKCLKLARQACLSLGHAWMGTGHLLAGVATEASGIGGHVLTDLGLTGEVVMGYLRLAPGPLSPLAAPAFTEVVYETPALTRALAGAANEALRLGHNHVGTEHLLISLMRDATSYAARLCELSCESAHLVVENTLLLCAPDLGSQVYANTSWSPHLQIIEVSLAALTDAGRRDPLAHEALADMARGLAKFRKAVSETWGSCAKVPGTVEVRDDAALGSHVVNFGSLWEACEVVRRRALKVTWNGKVIDPPSYDLWVQVLGAHAASLNRCAESEGWGLASLTRAHEELANPTDPHAMG